MLGHHHHHHDNRTQQQLLSYVQDYLECVESLPLDIQRNVSLLREIDSKYQEVLKEVDEVFEKYQGEQDASQRKRLQLQLQRALIISQELGDEKIGVVTQMTELVENRSRQMDSHSLGLQEPGMAGGGGTPDRPTSTATERRSASGGGGGGAALLPEASSASDLQRSSARRPRRQQQQQQQQQRTSESRGGGDSSLLSLAPPNGGGALGGGGGSLADEPAGEAEADPVPAPGSSSSSSAQQQQQQQPRSEKKSSSSSKSAKKKKRKSAKQERADASASPVDFAAVDPNEPTYCLCEQVSYGEMIGCDNEQCPIEWFHFSCVGLTYKPKGKWYCPKCRGGDNEKTMDKSLGDKNRKERRSR